jgi:hypothetical protein
MSRHAIVEPEDLSMVKTGGFSAKDARDVKHAPRTAYWFTERSHRK